MKIVAVLDDGNQVELKEIECLPDCDVLVCKIKHNIQPRILEDVEKELTKKCGKQVVLLPYFIDDILAVK